MQRFLKYTGVFVGSVLLGIALLVWTHALLVNRTALKNEKEIGILFLGDSMFETGLDDSIIKGSRNLAQTSCNYLYNYAKLRRLLENGVRIDTLVLAFSPANIHEHIEEAWLFKDSHIYTKLRVYYPILRAEEFGILLRGNRSGVAGSFISIIRGSYENIYNHLARGKDLTRNYGGYVYLERDKLPEALDIRAALDREAPVGFRPARFEIRYLEKIISTCREHGITLVFMNTPKRAELWDSPHYYTGEYYAYYTANYADIPLIDLHSFHIPADFYGDLNHLNYRGAEYFSTWIRDTGLVRMIEEYRYLPGPGSVIQ